jgi:hypothetical protein
MLPQETVAMQHIGRDDNNRSGSNRLASESILAESNPADGGDGRIEANSLLDHRAGEYQPIEQGCLGVPFSARSRSLPPPVIATRATETRRKSDQVNAFAVVSCPAAMNVKMFALTSRSLKP